MKYLLVDGHSVIFAWPELRERHGRRTAGARDELVRILTEHQDITGVRVVVVFDGRGDRNSTETEPGGIQIFYSSSSQSADQIIERLVAIYAKVHEFRVVSDDHLVQQTVNTFGAYWIGTDLFRREIEDSRSELTQRIRQHRRKR